MLDPESTLHLLGSNFIIIVESHVNSCKYVLCISSRMVIVYQMFTMNERMT